MGILNSRSSNFIFNFPKDWFYPEIQEKWTPYYKKQPLPYETAADFINVTVQSISFPGFNMEEVSQQKKGGKRIDFKSAKNVNDLYGNEVTINFAHVDGFFNYWMLQDNINLFLNFDQTDLYLPDFTIRILDNEGFIMTSIFMKEILFKSFSELELSYTNNSFDFKSFSVTFSYNNLEIKLEAAEKSIQLGRVF